MIESGADVAQWLTQWTPGYDVPGSLSLAATGVLMGKALYPHQVIRHR